MIKTTIKTVDQRRILGTSPTNKFSIRPTVKEVSFMFASSRFWVQKALLPASEEKSFGFGSSPSESWVTYNLLHSETDSSNLLRFLELGSHTLESSLLMDRVLWIADAWGYFHLSKLFDQIGYHRKFMQDTTAFPKMKRKVFTYLVLGLGFSFPVMDVLNFIIEKWDCGLLMEDN